MPDAILRRFGPTEWRVLSVTTLAPSSLHEHKHVLRTAKKVWADEELMGVLSTITFRSFKTTHVCIFATLKILNCVEAIKLSNSFSNQVRHAAHCVVLACIPVMHTFLTTKKASKIVEIPGKDCTVGDLVACLSWLDVPHQGTMPDITQQLASSNIWFDTRPKNVPIIHILSKLLPQRCQYRNLYNVSSDTNTYINKCLFVSGKL